MASEWKEIPLCQLYDFRSGLSKPRSEFGSGYAFLSFKDVFYNFFVPNELSELVNSTVREQESCSIRKGDVFLTRTSETMEDLGMSCVALKDYESATFNGFTKRLRPKAGTDIVPEYAGYYFRSPKFRSEVTTMSSLSTRASLNNEMLGRLVMILPSFDEQVTIGFILKSLDDKIELNRQMNRTLEKMAQAIFKSWFIDFDPVRAKAEGRDPGLPKEIADLFPDSFQDSELGEIPKGWEARPMDDIAEFLNGLACQKYPAVDGEPSLPVIKIRELRQGISDNTDRATPNTPAKYLVSDGDVLFSWSGSLLVDVWSGGPGLLNQHLFKITSEEYPKWFFFYWTSHHLEEFQRIAADKATTMGHIKRHHLTDAKVAVPPAAIMDAATDQIAPLFYSLLENDIQSLQLGRLRDTLLPKLISGELALPDAEEMLEERTI